MICDKNRTAVWPCRLFQSIPTNRTGKTPSDANSRVQRKRIFCRRVLRRRALSLPRVRTICAESFRVIPCFQEAGRFATQNRLTDTTCRPSSCASPVLAHYGETPNGSSIRPAALSGHNRTCNDKRFLSPDTAGKDKAKRTRHKQTLVFHPLFSSHLYHLKNIRIENLSVSSFRRNGSVQKFLLRNVLLSTSARFRYPVPIQAVPCGFTFSTQG